ncbi:hypothetical protein [Virgibacillus dokdonensis]|nr:hypothetical protein [Virgibacillus dokdonensis]
MNIVRQLFFYLPTDDDDPKTPYYYELGKESDLIKLGSGHIKTPYGMKQL